MLANFEKKSATAFFKGVIFALIFALSCVFLFALVLKITGGAGDFVVRTFCSVIKICSVAVACFFYCRKNKGAIRGGVTGVVCFFAIYLLFGVIGGNWSLDGGRVVDLILCVAAGVIFGVVFVNLKTDK